MELAKEVKIGNYVSEIGQKSALQIASGHTIDEIKDNVKQIAPLVIDEHWLLVLGFTMDYKNDVATRYYYKSNVYQMQFTEHTGWQFLFYNKPITCNYVHTLQNIYFFLSGEELEMIF